MKLFKTFNTLLISVFIVLSVQQAIIAQPIEKQLTLPQVIQIATEQSPAAFLAQHRFRSSYWQFRSYRASRLPELSLSATLPDLNRSISKITMPDGTDAFVERKLNNSSLDLYLRQNIAFTGGQIYMRTGLQRIDVFADSTVTSYLSTPVNIGLMQPVFSYNPYRWDKKIEPLMYEEARKQYIATMEEVKLLAVNYFFELTLAQINVEMAEINYMNNDTLFRIAQGRFNIGTISQNELLQMELNLLNSESALNNARLDLEMRQYDLRSFLGYNEKVNLILLLPQEIPDFDVEVQEAISQAKTNNPELLGFERQILEAQRSVAEARHENRFNANLFASFGLSQQAATVSNAYQNPQDEQMLRLGVEIPLLDWGKGRGRYKMAQSNQELVELNMKQAQIDFEQEVLLRVSRFNMQDEQVFIAKKADTIAQNRYDVTLQRFFIGKIDVIDLNIARQEKDEARRNYITALKNYWNYYFTIRQLTLYDFEKDQAITTDFEDLI